MLALLRVAAVVAMTSCSFSAADAAMASVTMGATTTTITTTVDNTKPRTDTEGNIVNAHQGHMTRFQVAGEWRYYWVGSAWAPCEPVNGKCVDGQPVNNGECMEPKTNGCLSMKYGACGFNNNNISIYSNPTLSNAGWRVETHDAVPRDTRAVGEYWQPNFEYNPNTKKYVMWWLWSKPNTTLGDVQVGVADTPGGPYTIVNSHMPLKYPSFTSANLFVDRSTFAAADDDPTGAAEAAAPVTAYVIYSSLQPKGSKFPTPAAVVQRLDDSWTNTTEPFVASPAFANGEGEVMLRWDSVDGKKTLYYGLAGTGCCFCPTGADVVVWRSPTPLGPWTQLNNINTPYGGPPSPSLSPSLSPSPGPRPAHVLGTGQITATGTPGAGGGTNQCLTASDNSKCVPNGGVLPGGGGSGEQCTVSLAPCVTPPEARQQWRLTAVGAVQSSVTPTGGSKHAMVMCLDAAHGTAGQLGYTNYCVPANPVGQLWEWTTTGAAGRLALRSSGTCANVSQNRTVTMGACSSGADDNTNETTTAPSTLWSFPKSAPLPPLPPPPPPPPTCHGCQVDCCAVPRKWELPAQQQGVTPLIPTDKPMGPVVPGCEGGMLVWSGDAWQQAPDDRKQHDPQWWVPLCFNATGGIQSLRGKEKWQLSSSGRGIMATA